MAIDALYNVQISLIYVFSLSIAKRSEKLHKRVEYVNDCLNTGSYINGKSSGPDMITKEQSLMIRKTRPAAVSRFILVEFYVFSRRFKM